MVSLRNKIIMSALVLGIIAPVSAMDTHTDSGWFSYKAIAGAGIVVAGATACVLYKWFKSPKPVLKVSDFVVLEDCTEVDEDGFVLVASNAETDEVVRNAQPESQLNLRTKPLPPVPGATLKLETREDIANMLADVNNELAILEKEISEAPVVIVTKPSKKPAAPKRTQKAKGNPQARAEEVAQAAKPAQPVKRVQGQSYGVTNQALSATKLKKTGVNTTPVKK